MRRLQRIVSATVLIALSGALAGCGSMSNWDPMDMLDFLDTKKKLPGDRKPVFPEGVPGLEQGVPKELYKGNAEQQQQMQQQQEAAAAAAPPSAEDARCEIEGQGQTDSGQRRSGAGPGSGAGSRCRSARRGGRHRRGPSGAKAQEAGPAAHHILAER
jgi:hypothetical protein